MSDTPYFIPAQDVLFEEEIKKSRFLTYISHTVGIKEAKSFIQQIKERHPTARHHCWGFIAGRPTDSMKWGFSDDGEPSGTAGKPILAQLSGSGVGELTAVVVRYSGGIKLGTGGLVKAYGGGVKQGLEQLETKLKIPQVELVFSAGYHYSNLIEQLIEQYQGSMINVDYVIDIHFTLAIPATKVDDFILELHNRSRGEINIAQD
ncbi:YigZ family protein [Vibrio sp. SS-MA-C1-2]|uniref:YigZ family protein n=1 Tax=Vibrio sp. SS-MA-C1-2 TaxID=2908646 RepID=UPI001F3F38F3|nr:YigZ family protein [Vibrio sp. SS-MA-C1-2]UJF19315.1 YigZ family protein [Vibrio sp. SS-MA-C1-2]